jgi:hypothetical protein
MNITNVIISYYIEVLNAQATVFHLSYIILFCVGPFPFFLAQFVFVFLNSSFTMITALGSAVSCFHILYVVKFDLLFSLDPQEVGKRTFVILATVISAPNAAAGIYYTYHGINADRSVESLTHLEMSMEGIDFLSIHLISWALIFFILSLVSFVYIPIVYRKRQTINQENQAIQQRTVSLERYLLGSVGFLAICTFALLSVSLNDSHRYLTVVFYLSSISLLFLPAYHFTEKEARYAAKRYLFNMFNIEERYVVQEIQCGLINREEKE